MGALAGWLHHPAHAPSNYYDNHRDLHASVPRQKLPDRQWGRSNFRDCSWRLNASPRGVIVQCIATMWPPLSRTTPFGLPVVPEVYRMYSGSVAASLAHSDFRPRPGVPPQTPT
jgi:hypothetical protein